MFGRRYTILEMESIPRDKAALQVQIIDSRKRLRSGNLKRFAALAMMFAACVIIASTWMPVRRPAVHFDTHIYLPVVPHE
jgi:hypothetical protein